MQSFWYVITRSHRGNFFWPRESRHVFTQHCRKATTTATTTLSSTSSTATVLRLLRSKIWQLRWVNSTRHLKPDTVTQISCILTLNPSVDSEATKTTSTSSSARKPSFGPTYVRVRVTSCDYSTTLQLLYCLYLRLSWFRKGLLLTPKQALLAPVECLMYAASRFLVGI